MKFFVFLKRLFIWLCVAAIDIPSFAGDPVNPNATPEARALLDLIYRISGKYTLTGQHNFPNTHDKNSRFAAKYTGHTPVIWSTDMGFAKDGDTDSYLARPDIVKEAIRKFKKGALITICWHAVPPTANEPVTFQPRGPVAKDSLASVQGQLTDEQFKELLTPGTKLYNHWAQQVDSVAVYLKQLQDAHVPVLWRPYHEMNGDWFWWGGRVGEYSTVKLYRQLYDRLVNVHKLNNLVWVWSVDRPSTPIRKFSNFYPGNDYLDILALDVYGSDFNQAYYDSLMSLSKGKPITLAEVGNPPSNEVLRNQPNWTYWVIWAGMVRNTTKQQFKDLYSNPRLLSLDNPDFWRVANPFRLACGLPPLPLKSKYPANFSGEWALNEEKSVELNPAGLGNSTAFHISAEQDDDQLQLKRSYVVEWGDDRVTNETILLDGSEMKTEFFNMPRISKTIWDKNQKKLTISSRAIFNRGGRPVEMSSQEEWTLENGGKTLKIVQTSTGFRDGEKKLILLYDRQPE